MRGGKKKVAGRPHVSLRHSHARPALNSSPWTQFDLAAAAIVDVLALAEHHLSNIKNMRDDGYDAVAVECIEPSLGLFLIHQP